MNGFLLGTFGRSLTNDYADYIKSLYLDENNAGILFTSSLQDNFSYTILCYRSESQKIYIKQDDDFLILCQGREIEHFYDLADTVKNYYGSGHLNKIKEINGVFSTLIIDKKNKNMVLLTDRLGIMPLYYHMGEDTLLFSSEMKGILASPNFRAKINKNILYELFHVGFIQAPDTLIENIASLGTTNLLFYDETLQLLTTKFSTTKEPDFIPAMDRMLLCLTDCLARRIKGHEEVGVLCSGGFDSALLVALLKRITNKKINLYTLFTDESNSEYQNTFKLNALFDTNNHYFKAQISDFVQHINDSLWQGESEAVGSLSVNIALEYAFTKFTRSASILFTGDAYMTSVDLCKQSPAFYAGNYGILNTKMTQEFLKKWPTSKLYYFNKIKQVIFAEDTYTSHKINRLETRAVLIGVLNGKIRMSINSNQSIHLPFMDDHFMQYVEQVQLHQPQQSDYRLIIKTMSDNFQLLPPDVLLKKKSWMPSLMTQLDENNLLDEFTAKIQHASSLCTHLFGDISNILLMLEQTQKYKFIMTLYYLESFHELFIQQQDKILGRLKNKLTLLCSNQKETVFAS